MLPIPLDTRRALRLPDQAESAAGAVACESRSLLFDRYANPQLKEDDREKFFEAAIRKSARPEKLEAWRAFLPTLCSQAGSLIYARLNSRLMINMAGGVMENAGLCLDRFGVPYIPGAAVKGCARRMAIEQLRESRAAGKSVNEIALLLVDIALTFGWGDTDWKAGRKRVRGNRRGELHTDFEFACGEGESWRSIRVIAASTLLDLLAVQARAHASEPWVDLPNFAGAAAFLPAYPWHLPERDLELDVLTCHHPEYYSQTKQHGKLAMPVALDSEQRIIPVIFPAVTRGIVLQFAVLPIRRRRCLSSPDKELHQLARAWLSEGLAQFGIGGKTAAGYGWLEPVSAPDAKPQAHAASERAPDPSCSNEGSQRSTAPSLHPLIAQWRGKTQTANFRAFRPLLARIEDAEELRRVFQSIMPANELQAMRANNPYWQSFRSHPDGQTILQRLRITLK